MLGEDKTLPNRIICFAAQQYIAVFVVIFGAVVKKREEDECRIRFS